MGCRCFILWNVCPTIKAPLCQKTTQEGFGIQTLNWVTLLLVSLQDFYSNKKSGCVFILPGHWHYKAMLWDGCVCVCVFFFCVFLRCVLQHGRIRRHEKQKSSQKQASSVFVWSNSLSLGGPSHENKALCPFSSAPHTPQHFFHTLIICNCLHARDFIDNEFPGL